MRITKKPIKDAKVKVRKIQKLQQKGLVVNQKMKEEDRYSLWLELRPMWNKWAYKMSQVDYEKADWEQQSYILLGEAVGTYDETYGISFTAYYRMLLYRTGKKCMLKQRDLLLFGEEGEHILYEKADKTVQIEQEVMYKEQEAFTHLILGQALDTLKPEERQIIEDFYLNHKPISKLAKEYETTYAAIECKKRRIMKKLKGFFEKNDGLKEQLTI